MTDKNMVDVADKAVDKIASGVEHMARAIERAAPVVWSAEIRFQLAWAIGTIVANLVMIVFAWLLFKRVQAWHKTEDGEFSSAMLFCAALVGVVVAGVAAVNFPDAFATIVSPEREAIRSLAGSFR